MMGKDRVTGFCIYYAIPLANILEINPSTYMKQSL